jgi:hypothetical protein
MTEEKRWLGLAALTFDAVEHGSRAVERVHLATAGRVFTILELIPVVNVPSRIVHVVHDATTSGVHAMVRGGARVVSAIVKGAMRGSFRLAASSTPRSARCEKSQRRSPASS